MGETLLFRFGNPELNLPDLISQKIFEAHFTHLKEHQTLLFTTRSKIDITGDIDDIIFVNQAKDQYYQAKVVAKGVFEKNPDDNTLLPPVPPVGYSVPKEYREKDNNQFELEKVIGYNWFAVKNADVQMKEFGKKIFKLSRKQSVVDAFDDLGTNQTPFRYVKKY